MTTPCRKFDTLYASEYVAFVSPKAASCGHFYFFKKSLRRKKTLFQKMLARYDAIRRNDFPVSRRDQNE